MVSSTMPATDPTLGVPVPEEAEEPRKISPFKLINAGEDTVDEDGAVQFADFRPRVVPADTPDEIDQPAPKDESAPAPAPSSESTQTTAPQKSDTTVPTPAEEGDGQLNPSGSSKPGSSSAPKTG